MSEVAISPSRSLPRQVGHETAHLHAVTPLEARRVAPVVRARPAEPASMAELIADLANARERIRHGDPLGTARQHAKGRLTARERLEIVLDPGSFHELDLFARHQATGFGLENSRPETDGVVTGWGTVHGRRVMVYAHDARIFGGALGEVFAQKIQKVMDLAEQAGIPVLGLGDGGGARIQEGVAALAGFGGIFRRNVRLSGVVPQISVVLGSCAGGAVYSPALTDFVLMARDTSAMFITGPDVVSAVTGEDVSQQELGGANVHASESGVAALVGPDERSCLEDARFLLSLLPSNNTERPPHYEPTDSPERRCRTDIVPTRASAPYDVRDVITDVVDDGEFLELHADWAANIVCGLARLDGHVVGIVGNQPLRLAGVLDVDASEKAGRFVRTCDAFNIPLLTLVDVPGFLPGTEQERAGIIRHGAKLLYAYCEATVPRISVVLRKAYGGAYIVMDSKSIGADLCFAWPASEVAVMGAEGAANIIFRKEIARAADPEGRRTELVQEYQDRLMHSYTAAERGLVDDVIDPADTRRILIEAFALLRDKRTSAPTRKHGNIPL
ncbi:MAG TPA: acyl-CoA carboxylase subunit beta [Candidatus Lustribacter sp.]|nr:acyl-CoA carboxylase subunit beta [Candidatus Lustribacter sp.]